MNAATLESLRKSAAAACSGFALPDRAELESTVLTHLLELARDKPENFPTSPHSITALARTIAVRRRADDVRREIAERTHLDRLARDPHRAPAAGEPPHPDPATREAIARAVATLDGDERLLVRLRIVEQMTLEEIELALATPISTIRRRLDAALEKFAREFRR
jgi:DNA-directed RNA polymerase specialized sigma24 family protein